MAIETGGPAFPYVETGDCGVREGMTLRDYLAAKMLPVAARMYSEYADDHGWDDQWRHGVAKDAYLMADAMLEARKS